MWLLFASLNPISEGLRSLVVKKTTCEVNPIIISWANNIVPVLLFTPGLFFIDLELNSTALIASTLTSILNTIATVMYIKAIYESDISEVMPMMAFTPLVLLFTVPVMVGEFPPLVGLTGIIAIVGRFVSSKH